LTILGFWGAQSWLLEWRVGDHVLIITQVFILWDADCFESPELLEESLGLTIRESQPWLVDPASVKENMGSQEAKGRGWKFKTSNVAE
jgi:hypothetical protein